MGIKRMLLNAFVKTKTTKGAYFQNIILAFFKERWIKLWQQVSRDMMKTVGANNNFRFVTHSRFSVIFQKRAFNNFTNEKRRVFTFFNENSKFRQNIYKTIRDVYITQHYFHITTKFCQKKLMNRYFQCLCCFLVHVCILVRV